MIRPRSSLENFKGIINSAFWDFILFKKSILEFSWINDVSIVKELIFDKIAIESESKQKEESIINFLFIRSWNKSVFAL